MEEAVMKQYQFKLSVDSNRKSVAIENDHDDPVGYVEKAALRNCEKRNTYSYTSTQGESLILGLKKRKFRDMNISKYIIVADDIELVFKERPGTSLLHFRVDGRIDDQFMSIEENWSGDMEVYFHGDHIATVKEDVASGDTLILADPHLDDHSLKFGILVLMYFMFKVYKRESWDIANLLA